MIGSSGKPRLVCIVNRPVISRHNNDNNQEEATITNMAEDRALLPNPFRGTPDEDASEWWRRLNNYHTFKGNDEATKLRLTKALFVEEGCDWLEGLENDKKDTYEHLETAFKARFVHPPVLKFRSAYELFGKKQRADETVDAYVNRLSTLSKKVDVDDKSLLYALVSGLRAPMASYVLGRNPQTFSEAVDAARLAEFSTGEGFQGDAQLSAQMLEMRKDIQKLAQRYDSMSVAAAIQNDRQRSPTPPSKRVTFQDGKDNGRITGDVNSRSYTPPRYGSRGPTGGSWRGRSSDCRPPCAPGGGRRPVFRGMARRCPKCGGPQHTNVNFCPALNKICYFCNKVGHLSRVCRAAK